MDTSAFTNPAIFGPGMWQAIHIMSVRATTPELKMAFEIFVRAICLNFKCEKCREHFQHFIDTHPFASYYGRRDSRGNDVGMFTWAFELHNAANKFLGKYQPTFEEAYSFWANQAAGVCKDCGHPPSQTSLKFTPLPVDRFPAAKFPQLQNPQAIPSIWRPAESGVSIVSPASSGRPGFQFVPRK
jgi:hypothetical protein